MDHALKLAIAGLAGRMGKQAASSAIGRGHILTGGTEAPGSPALQTDIGVLIGAPKPFNLLPQTEAHLAAADAQAWIDFTAPAATLDALQRLDNTGVCALVIGTTGFDAQQTETLSSYANRFAIVKAGNFSLGVTLMTALTRLAAARLGQGWDIEVLETHHRWKADAPSGTALMLGEAAASGRGQALTDVQAAPYLGQAADRTPGEIGFAVRRSGGVIGDHEVTFASETEVVSLSHSALNRSVFADGAIAAAEWAIAQPPGLYDMHDVLGLKDLANV